jgi:hypothetical protein
VVKPLIVIDPQPRSVEEIFEPNIWARLKDLGELAIHDGPGRMPAERFESQLPEMALLIGQRDMPKSRFDRASKLRAIINVEANFLQNVAYDVCFERGIHVLAPGSAFARPVAEMALGMAIDLCRGVTAADRAVRRGQEKWLLDGAEGCFSLYGARVGLIEFRDLAPSRRSSRPSAARSRLTILGRPSISCRLWRRLCVARRGVKDESGYRRIRLRNQREPGLCGETRVRDGRARLRVPADEPRGRGRFTRISAARSGAVVSAPRLTFFPRSLRRAKNRRAKSRACCCRRIAPAR